MLAKVSAVLKLELPFIWQLCHLFNRYQMSRIFIQGVSIFIVLRSWGEGSRDDIFQMLLDNKRTLSCRDVNIAGNNFPFSRVATKSYLVIAVLNLSWQSIWTLHCHLHPHSCNVDKLKIEELEICWVLFPPAQSTRCFRFPEMNICGKFQAANIFYII